MGKWNDRLIQNLEETVLDKESVQKQLNRVHEFMVRKV
ncbi:hypothetical protein CDAR_458901, partial [Caerostris darwini]